ncbi:MAG: hypothetical protein ACT4P0_12435 [Panacagrimonas sp.]
MALHYLGGNIGTLANQLRLSELAKARNVLVIVPQAPPLVSSLPLPGLIPKAASDGRLPRWPNTFDDSTLDDYVLLLDSAVADARSRFNVPTVPLYLSGLSNGGPMSIFYACKRPAAVAAVEPVAVNVPRAVLDECPAFAVVIVNGNRDLLSPFNGTLLAAGAKDMYENFKSDNGCVAAQETTATIPAVETDSDQIDAVFTSSGPCNFGKGVFLVKLDRGGHNWPGQDVDPLLGDINLLGGIARNWDATIYGYDLMKRAAGNTP